MITQTECNSRISPDSLGFRLTDKIWVEIDANSNAKVLSSFREISKRSASLLCSRRQNY